LEGELILPARIRAATLAVAATALATVGLSAVAQGASSPAAPHAQAASVTSNIAYAPADPAGSQGHLLDLFLPSGFSGPRPLVIWTSGSAWMSDTGKTGDDTIAAMLNPLGFAVAGVSVRSSSQAKFPAQVFDIKAAIRWLRANAAANQLDPTRFAIIGDSSGGWESDMATLTGGVSSLEGTLGTTGVSSSVQAGVSFFGPTDFLQMNAEGSQLDHNAAGSPESSLMGCAIQTCPTQVEQANPITYVTANEPPMLLLHGQSDPLVPWQQSQLLYNALMAKCDSAQLFLVPGAGHSDSDVLSSSRFGSQTVDTTQGCQQTSSVGSPNPNWSLIESFLQSALHVGSSSPSASPSTKPSTSPSPSPSMSPSSSPSPSTRPSTGGGTCSVSYVPNSWSNGFTTNITLTNTGTATVNGWTLTWSWAGNQQITSAWNATTTQSGMSATATNVSYNATIAPGANTTFGFQGTYSGTNASPTQFTLNGAVCSNG
jgi:acetyl esterase/lipase